MASYNWPPGGGSGGAGAAGLVNIGSGVSSIVVTYDVTLPSNVPPIFSFVNTTDASPIFLIGYVSAFSTSGFTVKFNALTDTANYQLAYAAIGAV